MVSLSVIWQWGAFQHYHNIYTVNCKLGDHQQGTIQSQLAHARGISLIIILVLLFSHIPLLLIYIHWKMPHEFQQNLTNHHHACHKNKTVKLHQLWQIFHKIKQSDIITPPPPIFFFCNFGKHVCHLISLFTLINQTHLKRHTDINKPRHYAGQHCTMYRRGSTHAKTFMKQNRY